jgi:hypothetical protein
MPRKLRIAKPRYEDVNPFIVAYLRTGAYPPDRVATSHRHDMWEMFKVSGPQAHARAALRQVWREVADDLLDRWIADRPGTRPYAWWLFDGPRWSRAALPPRCQDLGDIVLESLAEPRRRVGGIGTPAYEALNVMPSFAFGMPVEWVTAFDEAYYTGRACDIHGWPFGTEYYKGQVGAFAGVAVCTDDPPRFEAQATYCDRHGVLRPDERRVLTARDFEPEIADLTAEEEA